MTRTLLALSGAALLAALSFDNAVARDDGRYATRRSKAGSTA